MIAEHWLVSPRTVSRLIHSGELDCLRIGGTFRITREQAESFEAKASTVAQLKAERDHSRAFSASLIDPFERGRGIGSKLLREK